jgi:type I restriction enzyme S subunit
MPLHNLNSVYEGGGYKHEGLKFYSLEYKERHIVHPGDLIVANTEQGHHFLLIGFPAIIPSTASEVGLFSHHLYRVRPNQRSWLTPDWLFHLLLQPFVREQVIGCTNGTTVNMLQVDGLQIPRFVLPPARIVRAFDRFAIPARVLTEMHQVQNEIINPLRNALLPKLLSGEIRAPLNGGR